MSVKKILLVDDVKLSLQMERLALARSNCAILTAETGKEALESIKKEKPDLILLDLYMPEMNGDECCEIIKGDPLMNDIPVIMTTSMGDDGDREKCLSSGADDFIDKPFKSMDLLKKVEKFIDIIIRKHIRSATDGRVIFQHGSESYEGRIHDLGEGGMFIEGHDVLSLGSLLNLSFTIPGTNHELEVEGEVVRVSEGNVTFRQDVIKGMGIKFIDLSAEAEKYLLEFTH
jgi:CheY-like chemotaxis protein/Tfp pilus assembly protein PilZ